MIVSNQASEKPEITTTHNHQDRAFESKELQGQCVNDCCGIEGLHIFNNTLRLAVYPAWSRKVNISLLSQRKEGSAASNQAEDSFPGFSSRSIRRI